MIRDDSKRAKNMSLLEYMTGQVLAGAAVNSTNVNQLSDDHLKQAAVQVIRLAKAVVAELQAIEKAGHERS